MPNLDRVTVIQAFLEIVLIKFRKVQKIFHSPFQTLGSVASYDYHYFCSSRWQFSKEKSILPNQKQLFADLPLNTESVAQRCCLRPATLLNKRLWHRCFPEFCKIFKNIFFAEHLWATTSVNSCSENFT